MFGPFIVRSPTGRRCITTATDAAAFIRAVDCPARPHWRIAQRMVEWAWMSEADEKAAELAFKNAHAIYGILDG